jgi:CIC family chloride channel protein
LRGLLAETAIDPKDRLGRKDVEQSAVQTPARPNPGGALARSPSIPVARGVGMRELRAMNLLHPNAREGAPRSAPANAVGAKRLAAAAAKPIAPLSFALLAVLLGVVAGLGAYAFRALISLVHNLVFLGTISITYDSNQHTPPSPLGYAVALVPAVGALVVVFLVRNFAPEAKGHGVPEVMDAIYYKKGVIRPAVAVVKSLASAISIGSGGSVGREGPIIQIGAAFASSAGRLARASRWQLATLVAAGGGAGIAATFNTPIGGVLFAVEVLMHEVSVRTLVPVALATATATYVGRFLLGSHPAFDIPTLDLPAVSGAALLPAYLLLGAITACVSALFIRALYGSEDAFERAIPRREYLRHVMGMLGVGVLATSFMRVTGHYYVEGVGYATILDILSGRLDASGLLLALFAAKLLATSLTLGSGASGGVFSPSLFMGATVGAMYGAGVRALVPALHVAPAAFALAGMAGVVAGATGAALTAIVMIFEMTLDYSVVLPMTLTVAVSYGLRRYLCPESIYTMKLTRRGHYMPQALQANAYLVHHVSDMTLDQGMVLSADAGPDALDTSEDGNLPSCVVVRDGDRVVGVLPREWLLSHPSKVSSARRLADIARSDYVTVSPDATIVDLLALVVASHASVAVVIAPEPEGIGAAASKVLGIVTKATLAETLAEGMELFGD